MAYYRLTGTDGRPYTGGMPGIYQGKAHISEIVSDAEGERRHLFNATSNHMKPGWIWHPGAAHRGGLPGNERSRPPHPRSRAERQIVAKEVARRKAQAKQQQRNRLGLFVKEH